MHNGDLDSRDNVGLRAIWDWTREGVAFPALERFSLHVSAGERVALVGASGVGPSAATDADIEATAGNTGLPTVDELRPAGAPRTGRPCPVRLIRTGSGRRARTA